MKMLDAGLYEDQHVVSKKLYLPSSRHHDPCIEDGVCRAEERSIL